MSDTAAIVRRAFEQGLVVPAFNVPYLPMVEPVVRAIADCESFGLLETARLEWYKFEGKGLGPVKEEYDKWARPEVRLHLDHVPVIDEDAEAVGTGEAGAGHDRLHGKLLLRSHVEISM